DPKLRHDALQSGDEVVVQVRLPAGHEEPQPHHVGEAGAGTCEAGGGVAQGLRELAGEVIGEQAVRVLITRDLTRDADEAAAGGDGDMVVRDGLEHALRGEELDGHGMTSFDSYD